MIKTDVCFRLLHTVGTKSDAVRCDRKNAIQEESFGHALLGPIVPCDRTRGNTWIEIGRPPQKTAPYDTGNETKGSPRCGILENSRHSCRQHMKPLCTVRENHGTEKHTRAGIATTSEAAGPLPLSRMLTRLQRPASVAPSAFATVPSRRRRASVLPTPCHENAGKVFQYARRLAQHGG